MLKGRLVVEDLHQLWLGLFDLDAVQELVEEIEVVLVEVHPFAASEQDLLIISDEVQRLPQLTVQAGRILRVSDLDPQNVP